MGSIVDSPKVFYGKGCGMPLVVGSASKQRLSFKRPTGLPPVKTYDGGICEVDGCMTRLSRYNPDNVCSKHDGHKINW